MPESSLFGVPMLEGGSDYPTPDATADAKQVNDQFKYAEQFWGVKPVTSGALPGSPKTQQLVTETDTGKTKYWNGSTWVVIAEAANATKGSTAQRDLVYPTPGTGPARVALAATAPLWFNTDKGYWQQYFAQFDDAGASAAFSKKTHGWRAVGSERIPITAFTAGGGTPANVKKYGNTIELSGTSNSITVDNAFSADFDYYEIEIFVPTTTGTGNMTLQFRASGAAVGATQHAHQRVAGSGPSATAADGSGAANCVIASVDTANVGWIGKIRIFDPMVATERTHGLFEGANAGTNWMSGSVQLRQNSAVDGFAFAGLTMNAHTLIRVWGLSNGL